MCFVCTYLPIWTKTIHAIMQTSALTLIGLGLQATFDYTNSTNSPNLASLHSWTGIFVVSLFMANYAGGILIFANPWMDSQTKSTFLPIHQVTKDNAFHLIYDMQFSHTSSFFRPPFQFLALFTFVLSCFQVMTGIQELNIWSGACEYDVSTVDYAPAHLYYKISRGCKVSNGLGLCIFFLALTTIYAAIDLKVTQRRRGKAPESEHGGSSEKKGLFLIGSENDMREEEVL